MGARHDVLAMQQGGQTGDTVTLTLPREVAVAFGYAEPGTTGKLQAARDIIGACRIVLNPVSERPPVTPDHGADELRDSMRPGK